MIIKDTIIRPSGKVEKVDIDVDDNYFAPPPPPTPTFEQRLTALETKYIRLDTDLTAVKTTVSPVEKTI